MQKLTLLHTVATVIEPLTTIARELIPEVAISHLLDESILKNLIKIGKLNPETIRCVTDLIVSADRSGADAVLITCSSISPCADVGRRLVGIPVLKIDEPMAEEAVAKGNRVGVAATLKTTLEPTVGLIESKADEAGKQIEIRTSLCEGAFEAVNGGDVEKHDRIVTEALAELVENVDVVVLAQASMARLISQLSEDITTPILSSPRSGIKRAGEVLKGLELT